MEKRFLNETHFSHYSWLVFSPEANGLFCIVCALFKPASRTAGSGGQPLGKLVIGPLCNYDRLLGENGYLTSHARNGYHIAAIAKADAFRDSFKRKSTVLMQVDTHASNETRRNRELLMPVVKTVLFCARLNLPLRGHRDDGPLSAFPSDFNEQDDFETEHEAKQRINDGTWTSIESANDGCFRSLLRFRLDAGDQKLEQHLRNASKVATYTSKTAQNEFLSIAGNIVREKIIRSVTTCWQLDFHVLTDKQTG